VDTALEQVRARRADSLAGQRLAVINSPIRAGSGRPERAADARPRDGPSLDRAIPGSATPVLSAHRPPFRPTARSKRRSVGQTAAHGAALPHTGFGCGAKRRGGRVFAPHQA
jgi:hypothetical protein